MTLFWTDDALEQVSAIDEHLTLTSPQYAEMVVGDLFDRVRALVDYPNMVPVYKKANLPQVRELLVRSYRIIYYVGCNQIDIMAVLHQRQQ